MKTNLLQGALTALLVLLAVSCSDSENTVLLPKYTYSVELAPVLQQNAPALQSFAHGSSGDDWLLFAGRTNRMYDDGGLHKINGNSNYSTTSFVPLSFNDDVMVYNMKKDSIWEISMNELGSFIANYVSNYNITKDTAQLNKILPQIAEAVEAHKTIFRCTNPLITQEGDYLFVLGGYGTPVNDTENSNAYQTFSQFAKIHVPSMINLVKGTTSSLAQVDWQNLIAFGENEKLVSTGGEMFKIGETFYMAGGHNFGSTAPAASQGQQYVDAVYPFEVSSAGLAKLNLNLINLPITDVAVSELGTPTADANSKFRRRDGPIVPALFKNSSSQLVEGLTFYGGVFKPAVKKGPADSTYNEAWNTAIYVHPGIEAANPSPASPFYTIDPSYDQGNLNVYSCADFELYDPNTNKVHTFLFGGIGDGKVQAQTSMLSGFTDGLMHIEYDVNTGLSTSKIDNPYIFSVTGKYYGAESDFIPIAGLSKVSIDGEDTEIFNAGTVFGNANQVVVGYIYGGIEAIGQTPGTFGPGKSAASNKIWKVALTRTNN